MLNDPRIITQALDQTPTAPTTPQKEQENSCPADQVKTACGPGARGQQGPGSPLGLLGAALPEADPRLPMPRWLGP